MTRDPATAPPRTDLPFLLHRRRPAPAAPAPTVSASLDLSPTAAPLDLAPPRPVARPRRAVRRVAGRTVLTAAAPTVTLTPLQSGVGRLTVEAVCSPAVGDLRLACAYALRGGLSSTVDRSAGPANARSADSHLVLAGRHEEFEQVLVDLRRVRDVERLGVLAYSASHQPLQWGGTLVVTTTTGARVELPVDPGPPSPVAALLAVYAVDGTLTLRRTGRVFAGSVREACAAYGFEGITWMDDWTPVTR